MPKPAKHPDNIRQDVEDRAARWPSERTYSVVGWTLLFACAAILIYGFLPSRYFPVSRAVGFRLVITLILLFNALWWRLADRRFARHIRSARASRLLRAWTAVFAIALNLPIVWMLVLSRAPQLLSTWPTWYSGAVMIWHMGLVTLLPILSAARLLVLALLAARRRLAPSFGRQTVTHEPDTTEPDADRRALLKTAVATAPMILLAGATAATTREDGRFLVRRHRLPAPWLPERLRGLSITHVSDLHVGRHYRPAMLPRLVEAVNRLDSDLIVVTGDIVDMSNDMLPFAMDAMNQMKHRYGLFTCIGNHDEIDDRQEFIAEVRRHFPLLINERRTLNIGGENLCLAGIDFSRNDEQEGRRPGHRDNVRTCLQGYDAGREGPPIALAHHPHTFDHLVPHHVPLTLAGHTHGGQLMLTPPGSRAELGAGSLLFRYIRGFYRAAEGQLFVNSGVGNWFPLRMHAPAEIVQLTLV